MYLSIVLFFLFVSCNSNKNASQSDALNPEYVLDTIMVKSIDLSDRNEKEIVKYHLKVSNWNKPVEWEFYILSNTDTLLHERSNESLIDTFFYDDLYVRDCESYLDCKKKWYLDYIFNFEVENIMPNDSRIRLLKNVSKYFAEEENSVYGRTKEEAEANYNYFWNYYADKPIKVIYFSFAPEGRSTPILAFHPKLKKLIPIYKP